MSLELMVSVVILLMAIGVVVFASLLFVFHPDYEVGVVGVVGLMLLALAGIARLEDLFDGLGEMRVGPRSLIMWSGVALFVGQLAFRFLRRYFSCRHLPQWRHSGRAHMRERS